MQQWEHNTLSPTRRPSSSLRLPPPGYVQITATVGSAFSALGLQPKDRIGVIGANCPEWMMAMQASGGGGGAKWMMAMQASGRDGGGFASVPVGIGAWGGHVTPSNPQEFLPGPSNSLSNSHFFPQAMNRMDMVCVPLYDTLGEPAVQYIIKHAETRFVLSSGAKLALLARAVAKAKDVVSCGIAYWGEAPEETIKV